jgi:hypothetical protein
MLTGTLGTVSCQQESLELDPASGKTWKWILPRENLELALPAGKLGTGSSQ